MLIRQLCCRSRCAPIAGPGKLHTSDGALLPHTSDYPTISHVDCQVAEEGSKTLPAQASKRNNHLCERCGSHRSSILAICCHAPFLRKVVLRRQSFLLSYERNSGCWSRRVHLSPHGTFPLLPQRPPAEGKQVVSNEEPSGTSCCFLGLAATTASECAARATSAVLLQPIPACDAQSDACSTLSSVKPVSSHSKKARPTSSKVLATDPSLRVLWPCTRSWWVAPRTPLSPAARARSKAISVCGSASRG